jgi:hypothetical protein
MKTKSRKMTLAEIKQELAEVARIGQVFVDGDLCRQVWQPYAEKFMKGDDMDYNPVTTVPLKKTLFRLERISRVPCCTTLWRRRPDFPDSGEVLLFGFLSSPIGGDKPSNRGYRPPKMTPELEQVFLKGKCAWRVDRKSRAIRLHAERGLRVPCGKGLPSSAALELFVPIKDSMGAIAAALEVHTIAVVE